MEYVEIQRFESFEEIIKAINALEGDVLRVYYTCLHDMCNGPDTAYSLLRTCIELSEREDMRLLERVGFLEVQFHPQTNNGDPS